MWAIDPRFFSAEYSGLIAAPGTPKAQTTPSFSRICTAASIARIFAILRLAPMISAIEQSSGEATCLLNGRDFISRIVGHSLQKRGRSGVWTRREVGNFDLSPCNVYANLAVSTRSVRR